MASKLPPGNGARSSGGSGDRPYYDEYELDRKVRKRRARLVSAAEDAFTHIKRIRKDQLGECMHAVWFVWDRRCKTLLKSLTFSASISLHCTCL